LEDVSRIWAGARDDDDPTLPVVSALYIQASIYVVVSVFWRDAAQTVRIHQTKQARRRLSM